MTSIPCPSCSNQPNSSNDDINIFTTSDPAYIFLDAKARKPNKYLLSPIPAILDGKSPIIYPYADDSEYWHMTWEELLRVPESLRRRVVTYQIQHVFMPYPEMFVHPDYVTYVEKAHNPAWQLYHPKLTSGLGPFDYLQSLIRRFPLCGLNVSLSRNLDQLYCKDLPSCLWLEYGFFLLVDQYPQVFGEYLLDFDSLVRHGAINMTKRLRAQYTTYGDTCPTRWILTINGLPYRIDLAKADLGAIHGPASLERFAESVGIPMLDKAFMHADKRIERMHLTYQHFPDEFSRYGLTDANVPNRAFHANAHMLGMVYNDLGLLDYYAGESALTVGKTVIELFKSALYRHCAIAAKDTQAQKALIETYCLPASTWYFSRHINSSAQLLTKGFGGRCYNARPLLMRGVGAYGDIDAKGAYARSQQQQLYPLGLPVVYSYKLNNRQTKHLTLRQFLTNWGWGTSNNQLVPGLWYAVVSSPEDQELTYGQDILPSWFDFRLRNLRSQVPHGMLDEQADDEELNPDSGHVKIFSHQLLNSPITHDFLQMMYAVMSEAQREEWLDNVRVETAIVYPANKRVQSFADLQERYAHFEGTSECIIQEDDNGKITVSQVDDEGYYWYAVNLGDLLVTQLLDERYKHKSKSPLNEQFKLCINTLFGDLTSQYFTTSNAVVANNITARTRHMIWYAEKALYAVQSITDGGMFNLNQVPTSRDGRKVTASMVSLLMDAKDITKERQLVFRPLGGYVKIDLEKKDKYVTLHCHKPNGEVDTFVDDEAKQFVNRAAMTQLQTFFPGDIDILRQQQFEFEVKDFYTCVAFHGAANYQGDDAAPSMRSYEKKDHFTAELVDGKLVHGSVYDTTTPAKYFFTGFHADLNAMARSYPFAKTAILKFKAYCHNYLADHGQMPIIQPGQTIYKVGLLREFSPSQYTYRTKNQFKAIIQQWQRLKSKYEQSFEAFFITNGKLRYADMTHTLHKLIREGCENILQHFEPDRHHHRDPNARHRYFDLVRALRKHVQTLLNTSQSLVGESAYGDDDEEDNESFRFRADE